jgi:hypothetical protein
MIMTGLTFSDLAASTSSSPGVSSQPASDLEHRNADTYHRVGEVDAIVGGHVILHEGLRREDAAPVPPGFGGRLPWEHSHPEALGHRTLWMVQSVDGSMLLHLQFTFSHPNHDLPYKLSTIPSSLPTDLLPSLCCQRRCLPAPLCSEGGAEAYRRKRTSRRTHVHKFSTKRS